MCTGGAGVMHIGGGGVKRTGGCMESDADNECPGNVRGIAPSMSPKQASFLEFPRAFMRDPTPRGDGVKLKREGTETECEVGVM